MFNVVILSAFCKFPDTNISYIVHSDEKLQKKVYVFTFFGELCHYNMNKITIYIRVKNFQYQKKSKFGANTPYVAECQLATYV